MNSSNWWLVDKSSFLAVINSHSLASADRLVVLKLGWKEDDPSSRPGKIQPSLSPIEGWLVFDDIGVLALETSNAYLFIYFLGGNLIHKQAFRRQEQLLSWIYSVESHIPCGSIFFDGLKDNPRKGARFILSLGCKLTGISWCLLPFYIDASW
ncbi:hypothetical protein NE237_032522 [Protea cynaroides]|uniref:Uncharacterized protein n=1 Tax=Protea cynaroides TaxID=273540 RepID=A0A9Q0R365_9MAGN|nr:hypothetical protein NE237_032522 [Protea cynaroides]